MSKSSGSRAVYSTKLGRLCPQCQRATAACVCGKDRPADTGDGVVRIRRESRGRGGKAMTVIEGVPEHHEKLKLICKQLKQRCGVGGAVKGSQLELQGDQRSTCKQLLETMGYRVKLSGG